MNDTTAAQAGQPPRATDPQHDEAAPSDFAPTRPVQDGDTQSDWWPESADGQCSESAALFAASQPAPLSIV